MSKKIDKLNNLDTVLMPDKRGMSSVTDLTRRNLLLVIDKQNQIIDVLNNLLAKEDTK